MTLRKTIILLGPYQSDIFEPEPSTQPYQQVGSEDYGGKYFLVLLSTDQPLRLNQETQHAHHDTEHVFIELFVCPTQIQINYNYLMIVVVFNKLLQ